MKKQTLFFFLMGMMIFVSSCDHEYWDINCERGRGNIVSRQLHLPPIRSIDFELSGTVYLYSGLDQQIFVEGQSNILNDLNEVVRNGEWEIGFRECVRSHSDLVFHITLPRLEGVHLSGSGEIYLEDVFEIGDAHLGISGSGLIFGDLVGDNLYSTISGSGEIDVAGDVLYHDVRISGSGDLHAFNLY